MDSDNRQELIRKIEILTGLLEKHDAVQKEKEKIKSVTQQKQRSALPQKLSYPSRYKSKWVANSTQSLASFDKKYSFKKSNNLESVQEIRLDKSDTNKSSKFALPDGLKTLSVPKCSALYVENKSEKISNSCDAFDKMKFAKEVSSLTELLKRCKNSTAMNQNGQNKLPVHAASNSALNKNNSVKYKTISSQSGSLYNISKRTVIDSNRMSLNKLNSYAKLNSCNETEHFPMQINKFSYKKVNPINSDLISVPSNNSENETKNKIILGSHCRKVIFTNSKSIPKPCLSSTTDAALPPKPLSPNKQNLAVKFNVKKLSDGTVTSKNVSVDKESIHIKFKSPKVSKLKSTNTRYIKINKNSTTPSKSVTLKNVKSSAKKMKRKINTKYKVVNKTLTPCVSKKKVNLLSKSGSKENSPIALDESDPFLKNLNSSEMDKIERDMLAISTALTSTPVSMGDGARNAKMDCLKTKLATKDKSSSRLFKKMPLKMSKKRISKYKIVNSNVSQSYVLKKGNFDLSKIGLKKVNYSKFNLVNRHLQTAQTLSYVKPRNSVLVKRIFKSKNAIINKNASPISYSAKMIKSKYLTLNKRKSLSWQKHNSFSKVPLHNRKFKGYYLGHLHNRYNKPSSLAYHPRVLRKFSHYNSLSLSKKLVLNAKNKYRRKLKAGLYSPLVFIHGVRYSQNSSGKTLKKLPAKGQSLKYFGKSVIGGSKTSQSLLKTPILPSLASRVLHRSINRILSASTKKNLIKTNAYCMFYNRFGRCNRGVKCTYIHDPSKIAVCTRFLRGTCKNTGCPFSHEITPGKMAICSFFLVGACDKENCPYRHEKLSPDAALCKAFVQGYCPDGKECTKAHILICPKYIQGDCDKGSSCAFPHPPRKVKKNVQKEEKDDEKKSDDVLENVSRYFLQVRDCVSNKNESGEINTVNQVVPSRRSRLEEQPSFISL